MDRPLVLLAEDDASVRLTIQFVLEDEGYNVVEAADGEAALRLAKELVPDAILLDNSMPKLSGRDVFAALRAHEATADIPVFVLSGIARSVADWPGAYFIGKPFSPDDLVAMMRGVLEGTE